MVQFHIHNLSMKYIKGAMLAFCLVVSLCSHAQQEPMYSQYIFNSSVLNPAQSGAGRHNQAGILYRNQWVGLKGAPVTRSAFLNTSLFKGTGLAVGLVSDKIGPINRFSVHTDLAYHLKFSREWVASVGLRFMLNNTSVNLTNIDNISPDIQFSEDINSGYYLNAGFGFLVSNGQYFAGFSLPRTFNTYLGGSNSFYRQSYNHFVAYTGSSYNINSSWEFIPSLLLKRTKEVPMQLDVNFIVQWEEMLSFGALLRAKDAAGFLIGFNLSKKWHVGYVYEYPINEVNSVTWQTHEFALRYIWESRKSKGIRSPRFFL